MASELASEFYCSRAVFSRLQNCIPSSSSPHHCIQLKGSAWSLHCRMCAVLKNPCYEGVVLAADQSNEPFFHISNPASNKHSHWTMWGSTRKFYPASRSWERLCQCAQRAEERQLSVRFAGVLPHYTRPPGRCPLEASRRRHQLLQGHHRKCDDENVYQQ